MKIVYLFPHYAQKAGTERILIRKMNLLAELGHEVTALSYEQGNHPYAFSLSPIVRRVDLDVRFFPLYSYNVIKRFLMTLVLRKKLVAKLRVFVKDFCPDLIFCTTYAPFEIDALSQVCPSCGIPFIIESHSTYKNSFGADIISLVLHRQRPLTRKQLTYVKCVVALTEGDAQEWRKVTDHVNVIPNVVSQNPEKLYSDCSRKHVLFVGRFAEQKGLPDLLKIWENVHKRMPDWKLDMYGDGPLKNWLLKEVKRHDNGIVIHEPVGDIMKVYREGSILMLPSVYEPFGLVIAEAMSCGLPVVAYDCPYGPRDIITDGSDGFLVSPEKVDLFADALCKLMADEWLRKEMGKKGIEKVKKFSEVQIMPQWLNLLEKI